MSHGARARIRPAFLQRNLEVIRRAAGGSRIMAMVKANAYGHGLVESARALGAADALGVARVSEARILRSAGILAPIVVLDGIFSPGELDCVHELDLEVVVHDEVHLRWIETAGARLGAAWLKANTGMNRLGIDGSRLAEFSARLRRHADVIRLMTHLSSAEDKADTLTEQQLAAFLDLASEFDGEVSVANSAAILAWGERLADSNPQLVGKRSWVRAGLALYGISPFPGTTGSEIGLLPVMNFEASLVSVKPIAAGDRVGYNGTWTAPEATTIGIVAAGYGDGYSREVPTGTPVLVNGERVPVVGRISMDLTAVNLGPGTSACVGDTAVLWGDSLPVEEIAQCAGTIPYTLVAGLTHRESPIYEN